MHDLQGLGLLQIGMSAELADVFIQPLMSIYTCTLVTSSAPGWNVCDGLVESSDMSTKIRSCIKG